MHAYVNHKPLNPPLHSHAASSLFREGRVLLVRFWEFGEGFSDPGSKHLMPRTCRSRQKRDPCRQSLNLKPTLNPVNTREDSRRRPSRLARQAEKDIVGGLSGTSSSGFAEFRRIPVIVL